MFDRITHGRKLKSQRYAKKGENQKGMGMLFGFVVSLFENGNRGCYTI
jgi:hypothetical protein